MRQSYKNMFFFQSFYDIIVAIKIKWKGKK